MSSCSQSADITVVVTSCNRHDLLARTWKVSGPRRLRAAWRASWWRGWRCRSVRRLCPFGADHFRTGERAGQIRLIDQAYAKVETPFIFHLEDDWEFYRPGFMQQSRAFLETDPSILFGPAAGLE